ncbi:MAG: virulence protein E [Micavibrio sp.]|nr:virulence protein E [Micavibrio sp.]
MSEKEKDTSDSGWLFDGMCGLIRAGVPNGIILSVIKDERYGISAHVRKQGRRMNEYAQRQLQRAHAAVAASKNANWDLVDKAGNPRPSYNNARVAIQRLGIVCEYDTFRNRLKIGGHVLQHYQGELSDNVCSMLRQLILEKFGFDPQKENVRDAAQQLCIENHTDPIREYLDELRWDGVPRLERLLETYFGAADTDLNRAIARIMLIGSVRRVRQPGCKFDTMVVLEGIQGTGKSTALTILAGEEYFSDQELLSLDAKAQMEAVEGVWIYEIADLEGMSKSDVTKIKAFASRQTDRARPAYGRFRENKARRCIFVGTTNEDQYLRDKTGNRRFLPVRTGKIDLEGLRRDRDQLWAEAAQAEAAGESIVLPEALWGQAALLQESRVEPEPWLDTLGTVQGEKAGDIYRVSTAELMTNYLKIPPDRQNTAIAKRIVPVMRQLGWEGPKTLRLGPGKVQKGFIRAAEYLQAELPHYIEPHPDSGGKEGKESNDT